MMWAGLGLVLGATLAGCQTPLDKAQQDLIRKKGLGDKVFRLAMEDYTQVAGTIVDGAHRTDRENVNRIMTDWIRANTDASGQLTISAADLQVALARRDEALAVVSQSETEWARHQMACRRALANFAVMTEVTLATNEDVAQAKESWQAFLDSALTALGGVAAGAVAGATVIP